MPPTQLGAVITILVPQSPYRRSNTHYDSSREEIFGNVRAAVRQRPLSTSAICWRYPVLMSVRYQRMRGHEVNFICADDACVRRSALKAQQLGIGCRSK